MFRTIATLLVVLPGLLVADLYRPFEQVKIRFDDAAGLDRAVVGYTRFEPVPMPVATSGANAGLDACTVSGPILDAASPRDFSGPWPVDYTPPDTVLAAKKHLAAGGYFRGMMAGGSRLRPSWVASSCPGW